MVAVFPEKEKMALLKYAAKLRKMSRDEITFRLKQKIRNRQEVARWKREGGSDPYGLFIPAKVRNWDFKRYPFPRKSLKFFGLAEDSEVLRNEYRVRFPERSEQCVKLADELLNHQFHFLGLGVNLPKPIPWNRNPQTDKDYPPDHHSTIDTMNSSSYGDVKYVWELNRHQFFIEVASAYFLTGDEKYTQAIWDWFSTWVVDTPYKIGINNTSVLEHAVRIFSWIWTYFFTKDSAIWTNEHKEMFVKNLMLQGHMIEENLSFYYSPYNHLIGELAALAFLGTVYGNSQVMETWRDTYWHEMEEQLEKQFHADGFTVEQASYYHHFTVGFYLTVAVLRKQNGLPVSNEVFKTLEKTLEFSMNLTRPDGQLPMLGDIDSARSIYFYRPDPMWNLRPFLSLGAVLFQRPDMKFVAGSQSEEILWILGTEGAKTFQELEAQAPLYTSRRFSLSGYCIMRDGWEARNNYCCFDCGEIAHGVFKDGTPSAAHGHGDILSFELCIDGEPLLIDPGFTTYFGPLEWHRYFRSTAGHNTVEVNDCGQAVHEGRIAWSNVSSPKLDHWVSTDEFDFTSGAIDRFAQLGDNIRHHRTILFLKESYFLIVDKVEGDASDKAFQVKSSLHFHPGELSCDKDKLRYNNKLVSLLAVPDNTSKEVDVGGEQPDQGWVAQGYGQKSPAPVLQLNVSSVLPVYFGMLFPLAETRGRILDFTTTKPGQNVVSYTLRLSDSEERIYMNPKGVRYSLHLQNHIETDALCTIEKKMNDGTFESYFIKAGHLVSKESKFGSRLAEGELVGVKVVVDQTGEATTEIVGEND